MIDVSPPVATVTIADQSEDVGLAPALIVARPFSVPLVLVIVRQV